MLLYLSILNGKMQSELTKFFVCLIILNLAKVASIRNGEGYLRKKILVMTDRKVFSYCTISHLPFHIIKHIPMAQALNIRSAVCGEGCTWRCRNMKGHCMEKKQFWSQSVVLRTCNGWQRGVAEILNLWCEVYQDFLSLMPYLQCNP